MYILELDTEIFDYDNEDYIRFPYYAVATDFSIRINDEDCGHFDVAPIIVNIEAIDAKTLEYYNDFFNCKKITSLVVKEITLENLKEFYSSDFWKEDVAQKIWDKFCT